MLMFHFYMSIHCTEDDIENGVDHDEERRRSRLVIETRSPERDLSNSKAGGRLTF